MSIFRGYFLSALIILSTLGISCSSTSNTTKNTGADNSSAGSVYPGWYNNSRSLSATETAYSSFGNALAADSVKAAKKAVAQAKTRLKSGVSSRLESIRSDAVFELGSKTGLDSPRFIVVLRKAENEVANVAETENTEVQKNKAGNGYRAFAKASVDKELLIEELDRRFSGYAKAWNAMKNSKAFTNF